MADKTSKEPGRTANVVGTIDGYQDLDTGLVHKADGTVVTPEIKDPEKVLEVQQIGAYRRVVYTDGTVATAQIEAAGGGSEIETPVPRPGGEQDQTSQGLGDNGDAKVVKAPAKPSK